VRILRVIPTLNPSYGGPVEGLKRSTEILDSVGHETAVVCLDPPDAPWLASLPFRTHPLGPGTKPYGFSRKLAPFVRAEREQHDVAIVHGLWSYSSVGAWLGLRGGTTPYVLFTHGMMDPWFKREYPVKHAAKQLYWLVAQGRVLSDAQCVLFTTEEERRLARRSFFGFSRYREEVVAYGAAGPSGEPEAQIQAFRATLPALGERRFLLFLSRIHPKKGCDLLISSYAEVAAEHPDLDLVVAGPDESGWRKRLDDMALALGIAGRVHWPGMLTGDQKWGAFRAAEAFVLPSHQENFGVVVAEALASGKPVLITNKVNIWREVEAAGAGLVADDDAPGIAWVLRQFLGMSEVEKARMAAAARRCFERNFDAKAAASSLANVLRRVAGHSRLGEADVPDAVFRQLP
jgi:glycosyltransferase involved in cell wall biosynthesis